MGSTNNILDCITSIYLYNMNSQIVFFCYLILSPTVFSFTIPKFFEDAIGKRQGDFALDRQLEVPDNLVEVAAVGFLAGLVGPLFSMSASNATMNSTSTDGNKYYGYCGYPWTYWG